MDEWMDGWVELRIDDGQFFTHIPLNMSDKQHLSGLSTGLTGGLNLSEIREQYLINLLLCNVIAITYTVRQCRAFVPREDSLC